MGAITASAVCLTIAGFDPSAGAGVLADLKTISAHSLYAIACPTALTVQSTAGVRAVHALAPELVRATLDELLADLPIAGVKVGMLATAEIAHTVADFLVAARVPAVVVDPVLRSSSGAELLSPDGVRVLLERIVPLATVLTPNRAEFKALGGDALFAAGAKAIVVTGGDADETAHEAAHEDAHDWLMTSGGRRRRFEGVRIPTSSTHGTGCAFSSAVLCELVLGRDLEVAVAEGKRYVAEALIAAQPMGRGRGPIEHFWGRL